MHLIKYSVSWHSNLFNMTTIASYAVRNMMYGYGDAHPEQIHSETVDLIEVNISTPSRTAFLWNKHWEKAEADETCTACWWHKCCISCKGRNDCQSFQHLQWLLCCKATADAQQAISAALSTSSIPASAFLILCLLFSGTNKYDMMCNPTVQLCRTLP